MATPGVIERYGAYLPLPKGSPVVSLGEGNTPLIRAPGLEEAIAPGRAVYLKFEGLNPTGSFKDRGMAVAVSAAAANGPRAIVCASTGNTSASASAYAAKAGMRAVVLVPEGKVARGKLSQILIHGALVCEIQGNFDQALALAREIAERWPVTLVNSINPFRIEGQKTAAFEVCDQLGAAPDFHVLPVGNAGNITAYWKGYREYYSVGKVAHTPMMMGVQAEGAAPIVRGHPVDCPETVATAIRIGRPASWEGALAALKESEGSIDMVSDVEILTAYRLLARTEGIFAEPASAASVAGLKKFVCLEKIPRGSTVVCTLTGHGLKDPETAVQSAEVSPVRVPPDLDRLVEVIGL